MSEILRKERMVSASYCGSQPCMNTLYTLAMFQDCFCDYFEVLHTRNKRLHEEFGCYWVILRSDVKITGTLPQWNTIVFTETRVSRVTPFYMELDTVLMQDGVSFAVGRQQFCMLNLANHKPRRLNFMPELIALRATDALYEGKLERVDWDKMPDQPTYTSIVRSQDVDENGHCNNIAYVRFLMNAFSVRQEREHTVSSIDIQYLSECFEGEEFSVYRQDMDHSVQLVLNGQNGNEAIKAKITFTR